MILRHHSATLFTYRSDERYRQDPHHFKPVGLWLSVVGEHDWEWWCRSEEFNLDGLIHHTDFELTDSHHVLIITNASQLHQFTQQYTEYYPGQSYLRRINWTKVTEDFDGLIVAPYLWEYRLDRHVNWYYSWDCASGCIWNLRAIRQVSECVVSPPATERCQT